MKVGPVQPYGVSLYGVTAPQPAAPQAVTPQSVPERVQSPERSGQAFQLSPAERELFIRLFPESAPYIAHHVLFTREGQLHEPDIYKGTLLDIRV